MYILFTLSINNMSLLLLMFIAVPLVTIYKYISLMSLIFSYIYLGVIIIFIIIGIIILNIKMNLMVNPVLLIVLLILYDDKHIHINYINFNGVAIIFIILLILIYIICKLLIICYIKQLNFYFN